MIRNCALKPCVASVTLSWRRPRPNNSLENIDSLKSTGYDNAVSLYQQLLEAYPDYRRNDTVLYQLARAYEVGGRTDEALDVLNELVDKYPDTPLIDEVQFRRGEMLFLRKRYNDAEAAYQVVMIRRGVAILRTVAVQTRLVAIQAGVARRQSDAVFRVA